MKWLTFGGKALSDFGISVDGSQAYLKPSKTFLKYEIPGRNGDIVLAQNRYDNIVIPYKCFVRTGFERKYSELIDYLNSFNDYQKLETSEEPSIYRKALFHSSVTPQTGSFNLSGEFTLNFDCMPQEFLKSGDDPIKIQTGTLVKLINPTYQPSKPMIAVTAQGSGSIMIGGTNVHVNTGAYNSLYIDCETMDCYTISGGVVINMNSAVDMPLDYLTLQPGANEIYVTDLSIEITPRWWRV